VGVHVIVHVDTVTTVTVTTATFTIVAVDQSVITALIVLAMLITPLCTRADVVNVYTCRCLIIYTIVSFVIYVQC
jgi:hypothetical protein